MRRVLILVTLFLSISLTTWAAPPPASSSVGYQANVELRVDGMGRFVLLIDREGEGEAGLVDRALVYEARGPLPSIPPVRLRDVSVEESYGDDLHKLKLRSRRTPFLSVDLEVSPITSAKDEVLTLLPHSVVLRGGTALLSVGGQALWPTGYGQELPPAFAHARTEHLLTSIPLDDDPFAGSEACSSGGTGATSCSADCKGTIMGVEIGEECDVTCGKGYHACCNCTGAIGGKAECTCVPSVTDEPAEDYFSASFD